MIQTLHWDEIAEEGQELSVYRIDQPSISGWKLHQHDFHECFYVHSGTGQHLGPENSEALLSGCLYLISPERVHGFKARKKDNLVFINVAFHSRWLSQIGRHAPFLPLLWAKSENAAPIRLSEEGIAFFERFGQTFHACRGDGIDAMYFLAGLARVIRSLSFHQSHDRDPAPDWLIAGMERFRSPENARQGLPRFIQLCGRCREHVSRVLQAHYDLTPTAWINQARIQRARWQLENTSLDVIEIAADNGYENLSYFHRRFKQETGTSPLDYRKNSRRILTG